MRPPLRKTMVSVALLAAAVGAATAGARSQPAPLMLQAGAPALTAGTATLHRLGSAGYAGELRVANRGRCAGRLFLAVRGATAIVLREPGTGRVLFHGSGAGDLPVGRIAAGAVRALEVELRTDGGGRLGFRWTAAAI